MGSDTDPETLDPSESTDSDEVRNDDGDIVVDPPDNWSAAAGFGVTWREQREGESVDDKLAAEEPDVPTDSVTEDGPSRSHRGQVSGSPQDGDPLYNVVDE